MDLSAAFSEFVESLSFLRAKKEDVVDVSGCDVRVGTEGKGKGAIEDRATAHSGEATRASGSSARATEIKASANGGGVACGVACAEEGGPQETVSRESFRRPHHHV